MPVLFIGHGAPPLVDFPDWVAALAAWAKALPRPRAILMVSAHWEGAPVTLGATRTVPLVYDFYNFPARYYQTKYPAPGAPELAARVRTLLSEAGERTVDDPSRGLDHGAYVPLLVMYPQADVPVLQISMPTLDPARLYELGRRLAPLRDEGVLIIGSGFITHNLGAGFGDTTPAWASEFDAWTAHTLTRRDDDTLIDFMKRAPAARMAHPRTEHFVPLLLSAGAADQGEVPTFPVDGFWFGNFSKRSVQFG
ncbi:MAG: class III extradiol ring-cleavage dioxygenase [Pseudomonadota bacterium]|nr:class III extradiol ring-cleavage dioxygenase [Pseudomonadota bacterium]